MTVTGKVAAVDPLSFNIRNGYRRASRLQLIDQQNDFFCPRCLFPGPISEALATLLGWIIVVGAGAVVCPPLPFGPARPV